MAHIDTVVCAKMVTDVASHCSGAAPAQIRDAPSFDTLATSIAFGSAVIMAVTLVVVVLGIVVAVRWGQNVVREAKQEAASAADLHIAEKMRAWLNDDAPALVRTHVELILAQSPATPAADEAADQMGENA